MIDLTEIWDLIGQKFQNGLMNRIFRQQGIDGGEYAPVKESTMSARRFKSEKVAGKKIKSHKRLWVTGNYAKSAFNYVPDESGVTVFASNNMHPGGATYADITRYNSRNYEPNKFIVDPPLVFPRTVSEVAMMEEEIQYARYVLKEGITERLRVTIPERVEINVG